MCTCIKGLKILTLRTFELFVLMIATGCILVSIFLSTKQSWISISSFSPFQHVIILVQWTLTARPIAWQTRPKLTHISSAISHCFNEKTASRATGWKMGKWYWNIALFKWAEIMLQCKERVEVNNHQSDSKTDAIQITFFVLSFLKWLHENWCLEPDVLSWLRLCLCNLVFRSLAFLQTKY